MINNDLPIKYAIEDKLNRSTFAKNLAQSIVGFTSPSSFAIGLYGKWGSGKTSLVNMVLENVELRDKDIVIVRFNPWLCSDARQLIVEFFKQLSRAIKLKKNVADIAWKLVDQFAGLLESSSLVPYLGGVLAPAGKELQSIAKERNNEQKADLQKQKDDIAKKLQESGLRIVVSIDDIDRLSEKEIASVFQLVKSLADFPNTIYLLAFDYDVVINALKDVQYGKGKEYLEKVIQVPFEIPMPNLESIHDILISQLNKIVEDASQHKLDPSEWNNIFQTGIKTYVQTIRDAIRYVNVFSIKYSLLKDETDLSDLLGLTCLQVFEPEVYSKLPHLKSGLCGSNETYTYNGKNGKIEETRKAWEEINAEQDRITNLSTTGDLLCILFPRMHDVIKQSHALYRGYDHSYSFMNNKVASAKCFDRYFSLALETDAISTDRIQKILFEDNEIGVFNGIGMLYTEGKIHRLIESINAFTGTIDQQTVEPERICILIRALTKKWDTFPVEEEATFMVSLDTKIEYCILRLLKALEEDARYRLLRSIYDDPDVGIGALSYLLRRLGDDHAKYSEFKDKNPNPLVSEDLVDELEKKYINRIKEDISNDRIGESIRNADFIFVLKIIDPQVSIAACKALLVNDKSFAKVIRFGLSHGHMVTSKVVKTWGFKPKNIEPYIELKEAYHRVCRLAETDAFRTMDDCAKLDFAAFAYFMEHPSEQKEKDGVIGEGIVRERLNCFYDNNSPN